MLVVRGIGWFRHSLGTARWVPKRFRAGPPPLFPPPKFFYTANMTMLTIVLQCYRQGFEKPVTDRRLSAREMLQADASLSAHPPGLFECPPTEIGRRRW